MSIRTLHRPIEPAPFHAIGPSRSRIERLDDTLCIHQGLMLESGQWLKPARIAWQLTRPIEQPDAPCLIILGGISAHRQVHGNNGQTTGWWNSLVTDGRTVSPHQWRILSIDYLGGPGGSSDASSGSQTDGHCESISTADQALAVKCVLDHLGIDRVHALIGASYGGLVGYQFARRYPERLDRLITLGAADQPDRLASALRHVQRELVRLGIRSNHPSESLALARSLAICSYRSACEFNGRFKNSTTLANYLDHQGERFTERFDPASFLCLSSSIDEHRCPPSSITVPTRLIGFSGDQIAPPEQLTQLAERLPSCLSLDLVDTRYGHDGFLKEVDAVDAILSRCLDEGLSPYAEIVQ